MKTLIVPLSFLTLKALLLFLIFECYLWLLGFFNCLLTIRLISFFSVGECFVHSKKQCCSYINKPTIDRCCHQKVLEKLHGIPDNSKILEKYLWMNSDLIRIQFFSMLLNFHRKNEFFFSGVFQAFCEASLITAISQNSFQKHI